MTTPGIDIAFCWDFEDHAPADGLRKLKDCGFEGIELWPGWIDNFGTDAWADALRATRMRCFQLCPYFDFVHGPDEIARSRQELKRFLDIAQTLDCARLRVFTGPVPHAQAVGAAQATPEQWESAIVHLCEFCDTAAAQGVELCLECHEGMLMEDSPGALRLLTGVNRPNLTTNLQIPLLGEDWQATLRALGAYTIHIHMHNWPDERMTMENMTFISEGVFDWLPMLSALVHDYGRPICLSVEHPRHNNRHDSWETARRDGPYLREIRERILSAAPEETRDA